MDASVEGNLNSVVSRNGSNCCNERELLNWLNSLPLSKPVRTIERDLSDGVVVAEIIGHFLPRYVTLNAFVHVHSAALKKYNWESLDKVVLRHLGIRLGQETLESLAQGEPGAIQAFLPLLRAKIDEALGQRRFRPSSRSRSRPCSRGGSQLHLELVGLPGQSQPNGLPEKSNGQPVPVLDEMDKDQLIERLYAKVRAQELQLTRKQEQIEALTRKVDKLVELVCEGAGKVGNRPSDDGNEQNQLNGDFD